jgi:hypothetical protein
MLAEIRAAIMYEVSCGQTWAEVTAIHEADAAWVRVDDIGLALRLSPPSATVP